MLLAPDPLVIDIKFALKLKKDQYPNIDKYSGLCFSTFYIKVKKILLSCLSVIILYEQKKKKFRIFLLRIFDKDSVS